METSKLYMKGICITKDYLKTLIKSMFHKVTNHTPLLNIHKPLMVPLNPVGIDRLCRPDRVLSLQLIRIKGDRKVPVCKWLRFISHADNLLSASHVPQSHQFLKKKMI